MEVLTSLICLSRLCYTTKVLYRLYFCTISFCNFLQIKTRFYCSLSFCPSSLARGPQLAQAAIPSIYDQSGPGPEGPPFTTTPPTVWLMACPSALHNQSHQYLWSSYPLPGIIQGTSHPKVAKTKNLCPRVVGILF